MIAEGQLIGHGPAVAFQGDGVGVAWQTVKIGAVEAGKTFQFLQGTEFIEGLCIQLNGRVSGIASGTATGGFLGMAGMGSRIGAEEEFAGAGYDCITCRDMLQRGK